MHFKYDSCPDLATLTVHKRFGNFDTIAGTKGLKHLWQGMSCRGEYGTRQTKLGDMNGGQKKLSLGLHGYFNTIQEA